MPENQDHITHHVALTRGDMSGIYNVILESSYDRDARTGPADTEWATDINNPDQTISAANWAALNFTNWSDSYGGRLATTIANRDAVVHLITDDIYLDLRFTIWSGGASGGEFSYLRAAAPPSTSGDYNGDHVVNAADYTVWRDTLGRVVTAGTGADGNADGMINAGDYDVWRNHFGNLLPGAGGGAGQSLAVPEPASATLVCCAAIGVVHSQFKSSIVRRQSFVTTNWPPIMMNWSNHRCESRSLGAGRLQW